MKKIVLTLLTAAIIVSCMALTAIYKNGEQGIIDYAEDTAEVCGVLSYEYSDGNGGILKAPLRKVEVALWN